MIRRNTAHTSDNWVLSVIYSLPRSSQCARVSLLDLRVPTSGHKDLAEGKNRDCPRL